VVDDQQVADAIGLLSSVSAEILLKEPYSTQRYVMNAIANVIEFWERNGCVLDPIQREVVLDSLVATFCATAHIFSLGQTDAGDPASGSTDSGVEGSPGIHDQKRIWGDQTPGSNSSRGKRLLVLLLQVARRNTRT
jgi:hypothetical protein